MLEGPSDRRDRMQCPECQSDHIRKNGHRRGKQNHICVECGRQFVENPQTQLGYSDEVRELCLKMAVNGTGFRAIERITGVHHTTVIHWVKQVGELLPDAYDPEVVPNVGELDELQTFVGSKSGATPLRFPQQGNAHQDKQSLDLDRRRPL